MGRNISPRGVQNDSRKGLVRSEYDVTDGIDLLISLEHDLQRCPPQSIYSRGSVAAAFISTRVVLLLREERSDQSALFKSPPLVAFLIRYPSKVTKRGDLVLT